MREEVTKARNPIQHCMRYSLCQRYQTENTRKPEKCTKTEHGIGE